MKKVLLIDEDALDSLVGILRIEIKGAIDELKKEISTPPKEPEPEWVKSQEAMKILGCKKTKLQNIRDCAPENGIVMVKDGRDYSYLTKSLHEYRNRLILS